MINPNLDDIYEAESLPSTSSPEKSLLSSILARAILDLFGNKTAIKQQSPAVQALDWLESDSDADFSYKWICVHLDMDHVVLRTELLSRLERGDTFTIERVKRA